MSEPYTPTKAQIEDAYVQVHGSFAPGEHEKSLSEFVRWLNRVQTEARAEGIRGAAEAVHAEARWQQEQVMRGAVQKSGAETAVERLLVVETLLRQQADHFEQNGEGSGA